MSAFDPPREHATEIQSFEDISCPDMMSNLVIDPQSNVPIGDPSFHAGRNEDISDDSWEMGEEELNEMNERPDYSKLAPISQEHSAALGLCEQCRVQAPQIKAALQDRRNLERCDTLLFRTFRRDGTDIHCPLCKLIYSTWDQRDEGYFRFPESGGRLKPNDDDDGSKEVALKVTPLSYIELTSDIYDANFNVFKRDFVCLAIENEDNHKGCNFLTLYDLPNNGLGDIQESNDPSKDAKAQKYAVRKVDSALFDRDLVHGWMDTCTRVHRDRCRPMAMKNEDRLRVARRDIWLISCKDNTVVSGRLSDRYATLSYVWGAYKSINAAEWRPAHGRSLPEQLPLTIADAIKVTLQLGIDFLWVDQYCINQHDDSDKQDHISIMDLIYASSEITIIAAAGQDAGHGLPGVSDVKRIEQGYLKIDHDFELISTMVRPDDLIKISKWATRGWTYQEGILAKRRLVFTEEQVYFECGCIWAWESLQRPLAKLCDPNTKRHNPGCIAGYFLNGCQRNVDYRHRGPGDVQRSFQTGLEAYVQRQLTFDSDFLNAFKGFTEAHFPSRNFFGNHLVLTDGDLDMNPAVVGQDSDVAVNVALTKNISWIHGYKTDKRRAEWPSFSWVSWNGFPHIRRVDDIVSFVHFPDLDMETLVAKQPRKLQVRGLVSSFRKVNDELGRQARQDIWLDDKKKLLFRVPEMEVIYDTHNSCKEETEACVMEMLLLHKSFLDPSQPRMSQISLEERPTRPEGFLGLLFRRNTDGTVERIGDFWYRRDDRKPLDTREDRFDGLEQYLERPFVEETLILT